MKSVFKRGIKWLFGLLALLVILGGVFLVHVMYFKPANIAWFYERVFIEFALDDPEMLSSMGILRPLGLKYYEDDLTDASPAREVKLAEKLQTDLATLRSYDRSSLSEHAQLSFDVLEYFLDVQARVDRYRLHNYPVNQLFGVQNGYPRFMNEVHAVRGEDDALNYVSRLQKVEGKFAGVLAGLKEREQAGIIPPRFVLEKVLAEMRGFIATPAEKNTLYVEFVTKLKKLPETVINPGRRTSLKQSVARAITEKVYPAYQSLISYYEALLPKATTNHGVWSLPDGENYYALEVERNTTTKATPEQIHQLGLREVGRIESEMEAILIGAGYTQGSMAERVRKLSAEPAQLYPDNESGRQEILVDYKKIIDEISAGLTPYFDVMPKAPLEVKRVPPFAEKTAPGAYYNGPALDGSRPGVFFANLRDVKETPRFSMRTLAYHEGVPGHHFQIAIGQELKDVPTFRRILPFTAYNEGWALYAEQLAWEAGFQKDPLDNLGRLQAEMFRAVRLVVDTGMHYKRWTREQAIAYMEAKTGMPNGEVVAEIERYLVNPGQALAYKVGMMKILELREKAKRALGAQFDIRKFHNEILTHGSLPLTVLESVIDRYIAVTKAGTAQTSSAK